MVAITATGIIGLLAALFTTAGIFWKVFYGKQATERKLQRIEKKLQEVINESKKAYKAGDMVKHLILDNERELLAAERNRILRRLGQVN